MVLMQMGRERWKEILFGAAILLQILCVSRVFAGESELENSVRLTTRIAPGIINQWAQASHYFFETEDEELEKDNPAGVGEKPIHEIFKDRTAESSAKRVLHRRYLPLSWNLGLGYQRAESPAKGSDKAIVDQVYSVSTGMQWDVTPRWGVGANFSFDSVPDESYVFGVGLGRVDFVIPLRKSYKSRKKKVKEESSKNRDEYDPEDAFQYYRQKKQEEDQAIALQRKFPGTGENLELAKLQAEREEAKNQEQRDGQSARKRRDDDDYQGDPTDNDFIRWKHDRFFLTPYFKLIAQISAGVHGLSDKTLRRVSLGGVGVLGSILTQYTLSFEALLYYRPLATYSVGINAYVYGGNVDGFVRFIEADAFRRQPIVPRDGLSSLGNQFWSFPLATLNQRGEWKINDRDMVILETSQSFYASATQPSAFGLAQTYSTSIGKKWRGYVTGAVFFGGVASPLLSLGLTVDYRMD